MTEKFLGSNVSQDKTPVTSLVPKSPVPPGFSTRDEWEGFKLTVDRALKSRLLPESIKSIEQAIVIALKGRELDLDPLYALSQIYLVHNKPGLQAEVMRALIFRKYPKAKIEISTPPEERHLKVRIVAAREGGTDQVFEFTMDDAERAGLVTYNKAQDRFEGVKGKEVWSKYPAAMLIGRVTSQMARFLFPECIGGMGYTPEELEDQAVGRAKQVVATDVAAIDADFHEPSDTIPEEAPQEVTEAPAALAPGPTDLDAAFSNVTSDSKEPAPNVVDVAKLEAIAKTIVVPESVPDADLLPFERKESPGDYVIQYGRLIGKKLSQVGIAGAKEYLAGIEKSPKTPALKELASKIEAFIKEKQNG